MRIIFCVMLGVALLSACHSAAAKAPTCTQPVGKWQDQLQSVLEINTYDPAWHTTRPNSGVEWDHTITGAEPFLPME